jgi:carbon starvation protein CstA
MEDKDGFNKIWSWFGWGNQTLSVFTLWTLTVYLVQQKRAFIITLIPALFMTTVCSTFLFVSRQAFGLAAEVGYALGGVVLVVALVWFMVWYRKAMSRQ